MSDCHCHDDIIRDGSAQLNRYLRALDPSYAPVDGRSLEDLLVFAKKYAAQIRFYDIPESKIDDGADAAKISWEEFFGRDMAVIAASVAVTDLQAIKDDYNDIRDRLMLNPTREIFTALFSPILGILKKTDGWYSLATPGNPLRSDLDTAILSNLKEQVRKMIAYEEGFKSVDLKHPVKLDFSGISNVDLWGINDTIDPDDTIYTGADEAAKISNAALYVDDIFNSFFSFLSTITNNAEGYLQFALTQYPSHQPHMALFITFLQLYRLAQDQMNTLTEKLLNFYYRDVLHLTEKPSVPDRVYVVLELAKNVAQYDLAQATAFKAGKDAGGKDMIYATTADFVANQAKVKELKTIFIQKAQISQSDDSTVTAIQSVYARPIANSLDGFGEKITDPSGKWVTFGKGDPPAPGKNNPCEQLALAGMEQSRKDQAQLGFAIASPQLLLQGGKRLIIIGIRGLSTLLGNAANPFEISFTGEKGWMKVTRVMSEDEYNSLVQSLDTGLFGPDTSAISTSGYRVEGSSLFIYLPAAEQAVIPFDPKTHTGYEYITSQPIMQVMLNKQLPLSEDIYNRITINNLRIEVKVGSINPTDKEEQYYFDGLKTLIVQNDDGSVTPDKPFDPFTAYPAAGKSLYIGSQEVFNKPLGELAINLRLTSDIASDIQDEAVLKIKRSAAKIYDYRVSLLEEKDWLPLSTASGSLNFHRIQLTSDILYQPGPVGENGAQTGVKLNTDRKPLRNVTTWNAQTEKGFVRLDNLRPVYAGENMSLLQAAQDLAPELQVKEISVSYHSRLTALEAGVDQFFHVYPFGVAETYIYTSSRLREKGYQDIPLKPSQQQIKADRQKEDLLVDAKNLLFPQFTFPGPYTDLQSQANTAAIQKPALNHLETISPPAPTIKQAAFDYSNVIAYSTRYTANDTEGINQYTGHVAEQGLLYIGLENLQPLQSVSLLFQFAEGSAADEDDDPPPIHWSYLSSNEWKPLKEEQLISDSTEGFQATGIVRIEVPQDATSRNTIITDGLTWFCASVASDADRIPQLVGVVAQAVEAVFDDQNNDPSHFDQALPAGSISKLAVTVNEISKVNQPFASFDGKHREVGKEFYTRASERLRHKGRAITAWDYEHLVLDRFPHIYKVKCITHTDPNCLCRHTDIVLQDQDEQNDPGRHKPHAACCGPQVAPGHVLIVPVSDLKNRNAANPLQPQTGRKTLLAIEAYLQDKVSPFVHVHAKNPVYEQVIVAFRVQFYQGTDKGYYLKQLNDEIVHYLTPWAFDETADVQFGQKIYASSIIRFIESRTYVDFITDFFMGVCRDACCPEPKIPKHGVPEEQDKNSIDNISNCHDLLELMKATGKFRGETVAEPSTPRSILVSVPQHVIIPYEAPTHLSPCERRKLNASISPVVVNPPAPTPAPTPTPTPAPQPAPVVNPVTPVIDPVKPVVNPVNPVVVDPIKPVVDPVKPVVVDPLKPIVDPVKPIVDPVVDPVKPVVVDPLKPIVDPVKPIVNPVVDPINPIVNPVVVNPVVVNPVVNAVKSAVKAADVAKEKTTVKKNAVGKAAAKPAKKAATQKAAKKKTEVKKAATKKVSKPKK